MKLAIEHLRAQIQALEQSALDKPRTYVTTSLAELDAVLPGHGLPLGTFVELIPDEDGSGALSMALRMARAALAARPAWVVVDSEKTFYPPTAAALGCDLMHLALLRPEPHDAGWTFAQVLRSTDVGACFWVSDTLDNTLFRRLQLAAERGGGLGFVIRPVAALRKPRWSGARLRVSGSRFLVSGSELEDQNYVNNQKQETRNSKLFYAPLPVPELSALADSMPAPQPARNGGAALGCL